MARIRTIKPEFWTSEQIVECSRDARLLFIGLWNICDDGGVHPSSPRVIKMRVFPADDDITSESIRRMLGELSERGLIAFFEAESVEYLHVTGWDKHQKVDRPTFKYPRPRGTQGQKPKPARRALAEPSPPDTEGKGREEEGKDKPLSPPSGQMSAPGSDDGDDWRESISDHDRVLSALWRLEGVTEDQVRTWLVSTKGNHRRQVGQWLALGLPVADILQALAEVFDNPTIRNPVPYLTEVLTSRSKRQDREERRETGDWSPSDEPWKLRMGEFQRKGWWSDMWGPKPGEAGCRVPAELLKQTTPCTAEEGVAHG